MDNGIAFIGMLAIGLALRSNSSDPQDASLGNLIIAGLAVAAVRR